MAENRVIGATMESEDIRVKVDALRKDFVDLAKTIKDRTVTGTKEWAMENPGRSLGLLVGVSVGIGMIFGVMLGRCGRRG